MDDDELYQAYLSQLYPEAVTPRYTRAQRQSLAQTGVCAAYGELLYPSVKKIMKLFQMTSDDVFLDLGSGAGKCALQIFMQSDAKKVIGVEALPVLCAQAEHVKQQLAQDFPCFWEESRELQFVCDNFLQVDFSQATVAYACATCYSETLLAEIGEKANRAASIRQLLSLRPLPTLTRLPLKKVVALECSWDSALGFYYST